MSIPRAASVSACRRRRWAIIVPVAICSVAHIVAAAGPAAAQSSSVTTAADLATAIQVANAWTGSGPYAINFQGGITVQPTAQMIIGLALSNTAGLVVNGNGATIDMSQANGGAGDRAFFVADGTIAFNNLRIANGRAVGGNGGGGAGGGAGLGGGIFVANSAAIQGVPALPTFVTLSGVEFLGNAAVGGAGGAASNQNYDPSSGFLPWSGGGGMGGNGGQGYIGGIDTSGGGGGGFGFGASGGNASSDGEPGVAGALVVTLQGGGAGGYNGAAGGAGGYSGAAGGASLGGGGGGNDGLFERGAGGGGGAGGASANGSSGGDGRFGGGGGGAGDDGDDAGDGGFGGGGGSGEGTPGSGGFGGGGGAGYDGVSSTSAAELGGFGGGGGAAMFTNGGPGGSVTVALGGGGAGLGGAVFVMSGATLAVNGPSSFTGNTVTSGSGYALVFSGGGTFSSDNGSAYGPDLFVGGNVVLSPGYGQTIALTSLGGAGNLADPNVAPNAADPNANGSLSVTGGGLVTLGGTSFLSGAITLNSGTLALGPGAVEQGAAAVTVGQNAGDVATLQLGSSSTLTLGGFAGSDQPVVIARDAGSFGTVLIGDGPGSSGAFIGARVFAGGAGDATIEFAQQYAAGSTSDPVYPFFTTITGSVGIVQAGPGTTLLQPLYGANTFSGAVLIESGTLATSGTAAALGGISSISVGPHAGLLLGQSAGVADGASLTLADGVLRTTAALSEKFGPLVVTGSSVIDFLGNAATLEFSTLSLGGHLAIWNYSLPIDFLRIDSGAATGSLSRIAFYSDSGVTYLGEGMFSDTYYLVPAPGAPAAVPEIGLGGLGPAVALVAGVYGLIERRRRRVGSAGRAA